MYCYNYYSHFFAIYYYYSEIAAITYYYYILLFSHPWFKVSAGWTLSFWLVTARRYVIIGSIFFYVRRRPRWISTGSTSLVCTVAADVPFVPSGFLIYWLILHTHHHHHTLYLMYHVCFHGNTKCYKINY